MGNFYSIGRYHTVVIQIVEDGHSTKMPVLYLNTESGISVMWLLVSYFQAYPKRSLSWSREVARAIGLLYDYSYSVRHLNLKKPDILRRFILSVQHGTIDNITRLDETKLYWPPSSIRKTKKIRTTLVNFIQWCDGKKTLDSEGFKFSFPDYSSLNFFDLFAGYKLAKLSMMEHAKDIKKIAYNHKLSRFGFGVDLGYDSRDYLSTTRIYTEFPSELIGPLLEYGFVKDENATDPFEREDITAKMITLLLVGCGLRKGEPLHLWFNDVVPKNDAACLVSLYHPSEAKTNFMGEKGQLTRRVYLNTLGLRPRND